MLLKNFLLEPDWLGVRSGFDETAVTAIGRDCSTATEAGRRRSGGKADFLAVRSALCSLIAFS